jgi:hypothetical protein
LSATRRNLVHGPVIVAALASLAGSVGVLFLTSDTNIVWIVLTPCSSASHSAPTHQPT